MEKINGGRQIIQGKFWLVQSGLTGRFVCDVTRLLLWWDEKFRLPRNYLEPHENAVLPMKLVQSLSQTRRGVLAIRYRITSCVVINFWSGRRKPTHRGFHLTSYYYYAAPWEVYRNSNLHNSLQLRKHCINSY